MNLISFNIGNKNYFTKKNNYLIVDFINIETNKKILFKKINFFFEKKIFLNKLNFKIIAIVLKHFYIKSIFLKKKRRKNVVKKFLNLKKKTLLFIEDIY